MTSKLEWTYKLFIERWQQSGIIVAVRGLLRPLATAIHRFYLNKVWGMHIGEDCQISLSAKMDKTNPSGIYIGDRTAVSFNASVMSHDYTRRLRVDTCIGKECQIGAHSLIFPGVTIGDNCIVAPASVVMKDVPPNCLVAGNPARVMEKGIRTGRWGILLDKLEDKPANATEAADAAENADDQRRTAQRSD